MIRKGLILVIALLLPVSVSISVKASTHCLVDVAYMEARGTDAVGMALVQDVVWNRVYSRRWPDNVCSVVWQPKQFSWTAQGVSQPIQPDDKAAHATARRTALELLGGERQPNTKANHFLSPDALYRGLFPKWARCGGSGRGEEQLEKNCIIYNKQRVSKPLFTYKGLWFYKL